jgi:hypothetical protein
MSRSENLKRAKAFFQKKALKQKRDEIALQQVDHQIFYNGDLKFITIDRALTGSNYKVSGLVIEMIQPLLDTANEPEDMRGMFLFGVVAWNKGIQREVVDDPEFSKDFLFSEKLKDNPWINLLDDYVELKCTKYKEFKEYITDSKFSCTKDKVRFTVKTVLI